MTSMPATSGHSAACCNVPPVVSSGYTTKGSYQEIGGYKSYVTGPTDATKAILSVMDIFGFFEQSLQGADILATSGTKDKYLVLMPDQFNGEPCPIDVWPPNTEEKQNTLKSFIGSNMPTKGVEMIPGYIKAAQEKYPSIKSWGIIGFCWGGKVLPIVTGQDSNVFKAGVACHPAMLDPEQAKLVKVPICILASKDEDANEVKEFGEALSVEKHVEIFEDQVHGWMSARADLADERVKAEYKRGYETAIDWFSKYV